MKRAKESRPSTKSGHPNGRCSHVAARPRHSIAKAGATAELDPAPLLNCRHRRPYFGTLILRTAETENWEKDKTEQSQTDTEARAFAECFRDIDAQNNPDDEVDERDQHQDEPPTRAAGDFAHYIDVVDGDNCGPAWLSRFAEDLPDRSNQQNDDGEITDPEDRAGRRGRGWRGRFVGLCEQRSHRQ